MLYRSLFGIVSFLSLFSAMVYAAARTPPGADVPWMRYEAEDARSNVEPSQASREYLTPESEAAGRRLVRLAAPGDHVEFDVRKRADGLVLRYGIPDSGEGGGQDATLSLYINGSFLRKVTLTSRLSWVYGDLTWTNDPLAGRGHNFFDEFQAVIPGVAPGDTVRLQVDDGDDAAYYLVDFIELEPVPSLLPAPDGSLSIEEFGAIPNDGIEDTDAFLQLIEAAREQGRVAWIPRGSFILNGSFKDIGGVDIRGAGMWHSRLTGSAPMFYGNGRRFAVSDLAIFGQVDYRNDYSPDNAFNGDLGDGTELVRLWIEHLKCGVWSNHGTKNLRITGCRIRNTMADGVNLCDGTVDSLVEQCHFRSNGDDAMATWSPTGDWSSKQPCRRNRFVHNTAENPWLANGVGVYGGSDHVVTGNLVVDTVLSGGGLLVSSGHGAIPFEGTVTADNNRFVRTGGQCYADGRNGAVWFHAMDSDIGAEVVIRDLEVIDSGFALVSVHGPRSVRSITLENIHGDGHGTEDVVIHPSSAGATIIRDGVVVQRSGDDRN